MIESLSKFAILLGLFLSAVGTLILALDLLSQQYFSKLESDIRETIETLGFNKNLRKYFRSILWTKNESLKDNEIVIKNFLIGSSFVFYFLIISLLPLLGYLINFDLQEIVKDIDYLQPLFIFFSLISLAIATFAMMIIIFRIAFYFATLLMFFTIHFLELSFDLKEDSKISSATRLYGLFILLFGFILQFIGTIYS